MNGIIASSFLACATFLETLKAATATTKRCSYSHYGDTSYYTCLNTQVCCGTNSCCYPKDHYYSVYDLWYFWFCLCFGIFICSLASGAYHRKRQIRGVQVAAIQPRDPPGQYGGNTVRVLQGHGAMVGSRLGPDGMMHSPPRNVMVTATDASGQPVYPTQAYFNGPPPNYGMYGPGGPSGPVYPAYAYLPPPPSYSSLATAPASSSTSATPSSVPTSPLASSTASGSSVPKVSA